MGGESFLSVYNLYLVPTMKNELMKYQQRRSYTLAHTGLGPGKSFEVNVPEPSGVARNGPIGLGPTTRKSSLHYNINNSSLFQVASYIVSSCQFCTDRYHAVSATCQLARLDAQFT